MTTNLIGQRVATMPHTDAFMRGQRFGEVTKVGTKLVHVRMDTGQVLMFRIAGRDFDRRVPGLKVVDNG